MCRDCVSQQWCGWLSASGVFGSTCKEAEDMEERRGWKGLVSVWRALYPLDSTKSIAETLQQLHKQGGCQYSPLDEVSGKIRRLFFSFFLVFFLRF